MTDQVPGMDLCKELFRWSSEQMEVARTFAESASRQIELRNFERARDLLADAQRRLNSALAAREFYTKFCQR
jgi:hypothetical protein